jgi:proton-coupled amino acid transporter
MLLVLLIPIGLISDLKYLVPLSALAKIFILSSFVITLYYIFRDILDASNKKYIANIEKLPLFFATVIFTMEGIGVVTTFTDISLSIPRTFIYVQFSKPNKLMANCRHTGYGLAKIDVHGQTSI